MMLVALLVAAACTALTAYQARTFGWSWNKYVLVCGLVFFVIFGALCGLFNLLGIL